MPSEIIDNNYQFPDWIEKIVPCNQVLSYIKSYHMEKLAEDICQQLLMALENAKVRDKEITSYYAYKALRNIIYKIWWGQIKEQSKIKSVKPLDDLIHDNPLGKLIKDEQIEFLLDLISHLDKSEKQILKLRASRGLTYKQIASAMDKSESAVRLKYSEVFNQLKKLMMNQFD